MRNVYNLVILGCIFVTVLFVFNLVVSTLYWHYYLYR
jgi:hypothetical protein